MLRHIPLARALALAVGAIGCPALLGCRDATVRLSASDVRTWQHTIAGGTADFAETGAVVRVYDDKTFAVTVEGDVRVRGDSVAPTVVIPVALLREAPEYIGPAGVSDSSHAETLTYRASGGLWCAAVIVPVPRAIVPAAGVPAAGVSVPGGTGPGSVHLSVRLVLASNQFAGTAPVLVPAIGATGPVDVRFELPAGSRLLKPTLRIVDVDRATERTLVALPAELGDGMVRAAASPYGTAGTAWDFTGMRYALPAAVAPRGPISRERLVISVPLTIFGVGWIIFFAIRLAGPFAPSPRPFEPQPFEPQPFEPRSFDPRSSDPRPSDLAKSEATVPLMDERRVREDERERKWRRARSRSYVALIWTTAVAVAVGLVLTVYTVAAPAPREGTVVPGLAVDPVILGNLQITASTPDSSADTVGVALAFTALPTKASAVGNATVALVPVDPVGSFKHFDVHASSRAIAFRQTGGGKTSVDVPTAAQALHPLTVIKLAVLGDPGSGVPRFTATRDYGDLMRDAPSITVQYAVPNCEPPRPRSWIHWFPWDGRAICTSVRLSRPALVSRIQILEPKGFALGAVTAAPLELSQPARREGAVLTIQDLGVQGYSAPLAANKRFHLRADFHRSGLVRWGLTILPLVTAVIAGIGLGFLARTNAGGWAAGVLGAIGFVPIHVGIHNQITDNYRVPTVFALGGQLTVFDALYFLGWLVLIVLAVLVGSRRLFPDGR